MDLLCFHGGACNLPSPKTRRDQSFSSDFLIVINALNAIHEKLLGSHANYNAVETTNTSSMNKIASALKG